MLTNSLIPTLPVRPQGRLILFPKTQPHRFETLLSRHLLQGPDK